jgi:hypothetical protein
VLCQITSQLRPDAYSVPLSARDFEQGHLAVDSFVRANRLLTVDQSVVIYSAARVRPGKLAEVRATIRQLFA